MIDSILQQFISGIQSTTALEYIGVLCGIVSVWFSRKENILVYPSGIINTIIYIYLSYKYHLPGEAAVNIYYTVMNMYGWWLWSRKNKEQQHLVEISYSNRRWRIYQLSFFLAFYVTLFICITYLKKAFYPGAIPWADALAAATAFTGMWLMAKKKVESWYWWIATNIASIPLYFVKGLVFTSVYYIVLLVLAFYGLAEWKRRVKLR